MRCVGLGILVLAASSLSPAFAQPAKPVVDAHGDPLPMGASLRLGTVAFRHRFEMPSFVYAPDGKTIASPDNDHVKIWDVATGKVVRTMTLSPPAPGSSWWFHHVAFSPDGTLFLASAGTRTSEGGSSIASRVFVWDAASGRFQKAINRTGLADFCFCGDSRTIAIAEQSQVTVWDATTAKKVGATENLTEARIRTLAFIPRLKQIVAGDDRDKLHFWKLDGLDLVGSLKIAGQAGAIGVSSDGRFAAEAGSGLTVRNVETRDTVVELQNGGPVVSADFSPDGSLIAVGHRWGQIVVWETATWKKRHVLANGQGDCEVRFSPDGKTIACSDSTDLVLRFWDAQSGKRLHRTAGHEGAVVALAFSPGGQRLGSTASDSAVRIWDPKSGKEARVHEGPNVAGVAWSLDGAMMSSGLQIFGAEDEKPLRQLSDQPRSWLDGPFRSLAFSLDGKLTAANYREVLWWDAKSGKSLDHVIPKYGSVEAVVSPGGSRAVILGADGTTPIISVWDLIANRQVHEFRSPNGLKEAFVPTNGKLAMSSDGKRFAFGNASIRVFDLADPKHPRTFGESRRLIRSLAFAPHGKMIAVGRDDESVELWDIATERQIAMFRTSQGHVASIAFAPDGRLLATGGADSTVLLWRLRDVLADVAAIDVATLWKDLGQGEDVGKAYRAIERLAARPDEALPMFREKLKTRTPVPAERLARLFADLDADDFGTREQATRDLAALGDVIEHDLMKLRKEAASPEVARRAAGLLDRLANRTPVDQGSLRAVLVLEAIDSPDAIRLLEELGRGAPGAGLTIEARAATERIARRRQAQR